MKRKDIIYNKVVSLLLLAVVMCQYGCSMSEIDLCHDKHPHRGQLIVEYDWTKINGEHPDSMIVMALRPVFRDKMSSNWASDVAPGENRRYGRFIASASDKEDLYYESQRNNKYRHFIYLPAGEWEVYSYTSNEDTESNVLEYTQNVMDNGDNLYFKTKILKSLPPKYAYWYDRNPEASWVDASMNEAVCLAKGSVIVDEYANVQKNYKVQLTPHIVSQRVNVNFGAQVVDNDISVDSIVCAISGIADAMNLITSGLKIDILHQTIFKTDVSLQPGGLIKASGTVYVPGLVRSIVPSLLQGPGILNASVFVHFTDNQNVRKERRLDATVNLYRLLTNTPSVKYDQNGIVVQTTNEITLNVHSTLLISKDKLTNADDAQDNWIDETFIDVEV